MFRRSSVIVAASLALLSTLDSATCFAAPAPAQPRDDVDRPRFIRKEIKRFVFSNTTRSEPPSEASTSDLEALHDSLTSSSSQDLGPDATPTSATSATSAITTTPSVTLADNGPSSTSDVSVSAAGVSDSDREEFLALQSSTTTSPVSSARPPSSSPNGEGATTQSSVAPGADSDVATSSQSLPSSSPSPPDQTTANRIVPQTTQSSTAEQLGNSLTLSQQASIAQTETSAVTSNAATPSSQGNLQATLEISHESSSSIPSQASVSISGEQGPSALGSQTTTNPGQQTDTQVQSSNTEGANTHESGASSEGAGTPPSATSNAGSSSVALPAGETIVSSSGTDNGLTGAVTTASGGPESVPTTAAGVGSSTVVAPAGTIINSNVNGEADQSSTTPVKPATQGPNSLVESTAGAVSSAVVPPAGTTISSNPNEESGRLASAVTSAAGGSESAPVTIAGSASSAVVLPAGATTENSANDEPSDLTLGSATATAGIPLVATSAASATKSGDTIQTSAQDILTPSSLGAEVTSGVPALSTNTGKEGSGSINTIVSQIVPNTSGSGPGVVSTPAAEPASSPVAPQSAVPATGTSIGSETGQVTVGSGDVQPTVTPTIGAGQTSQGNGLPASSASVAPQSNAGQTVSQTGASPPQTTLSDGAVVPNTAQSVVPATGTILGSETGQVTVGSGDVQPTVTPTIGAGQTSQGNGLPASSASVAPQSNAGQTVSQTGASPPQTTLSDGAVVPNTAQITATPLVTPASVSSPGVPQTASPSVNAGVTEAASIANPSVAEAASILNTIPASIENPLSSVSGNSPFVINPAYTSAAAALKTLPVSVQNPEHQNTPVSSPNSASPVISGGSSPGSTAAGLSVSTGSPIEGTESLGATASGSPVSGSVLPGGTQSPGATASGSPVGESVLPGGTQSPGATASRSPGGGSVSLVGTESPGATASRSPGGGSVSLVGTESPATVSGSLISGSASPVGTESPGATATGSLASGSALPLGATESQRPISSPVGVSVSPIGATESHGATGLSGEPTAGQVSGQNTQQTATGSVVPQSGPTTASNGEVISVTPASNLQSATPESGIARYSTQSNGIVVPVSAAAGTGSTVSNGQIVPAATDHGASTQQSGPSETGAAAASSAAAQSAASVAAGATQSNAATPGVTATPASPPPQEFTGKGPYTQSPVGYDTSTTQPVPTSIIHGPSSTPSATQGHYFGPSSLPSNVPQILYQNGGPGSQPANTRLINIAFRYPLNYLFVYNHTDSQKQIFYYIPQGISYGLEIDASQIKMQSLRAWDTYEDVGYVTTLALAWIPEGLVDNLALLVSTPVSRFYHNPDNSTAFLLSMINNAIPITGSNGTDGSNTAIGNIPPDTTSAKTAGAPIGGDIGNSEHVRASSVGIGVGVACGAAAYGAAMFFVARRYRKRRLSHTRSPSMFSSPVMSHAGPDAGAGAALMSGAMGERSASPYYDNDGRAGSRGSGRSGSSRHQISAPVMAENSLGWN